ncbi:MAG: hypothetical protein ACYDA2_10705 [Acidimicrobiales bacterium]
MPSAHSRTFRAPLVQALYERLVGAAYEHGKAINVAVAFEVDEVVDPAETRTRLATLLAAAPARHWRTRPRKRPCIDTW